MFFICEPEYLFIIILFFPLEAKINGRLFLTLHKSDLLERKLKTSIGFQMHVQNIIQNLVILDFFLIFLIHKMLAYLYFYPGTNS